MLVVDNILVDNRQVTANVAGLPWGTTTAVIAATFKWSPT